jgi:hypothetical protein
MDTEKSVVLEAVEGISLKSSTANKVKSTIDVVALIQEVESLVTQRESFRHRMLRAEARVRELEAAAKK